MGWGHRNALCAATPAAGSAAAGRCSASCTRSSACARDSWDLEKLTLRPKLGRDLLVAEAFDVMHPDDGAGDLRQARQRALEVDQFRRRRILRHQAIGRSRVSSSPGSTATSALARPVARANAGTSGIGAAPPAAPTHRTAPHRGTAAAGAAGRIMQSWKTSSAAAWLRTSAADQREHRAGGLLVDLALGGAVARPRPAQAILGQRDRQEAAHAPKMRQSGEKVAVFSD